MRSGSSSAGRFRLGQAGLAAIQTLTLLTVANRAPGGGVVAFQIALSFYYLGENLGVTPVALSAHAPAGADASRR